MDTEVLNVVGEITRAEAKALQPEAESADYAELSPGGFIQMWYKKLPLDYWSTSEKLSKPVWHYLSYAKLWIGSSDDMTKKRLLKLV